MVGKRMFGGSRLLVLGGTALAAAAIVGGVFAFTASNTVPASQAGEGQGTISGYVLSSVHYGLNASDPTKIDSVQFTLDSAPAVGSSIKVKLVSAGSTWYSCTNAGTAVTCATTSTQATVATADQLTAVVAQ
jgi:hypothetical protein